MIGVLMGLAYVLVVLIIVILITVLQLDDTETRSSLILVGKVLNGFVFAILIVVLFV